MLGVSIQKLQLLGAMPRHVIEGFPTINWLGFYPSYEPLIAQAAYIMVVAILIFKFKNKNRPSACFLLRCWKYSVLQYNDNHSINSYKINVLAVCLGM